MQSFPRYNKSAAEDFEKHLGKNVKKSQLMGVDLLNRVENIVAKGEIAHNEQSHILSHCFLKSSAAESSESICMRKWLKKN